MLLCGCSWGNAGLFVHRKNRMREIRPSGSEGGAGSQIPVPTPISAVNGQTIEPQTEWLLKAGDRIRVGKRDAVFDPEHAEAGAHELPSGDERVLTAASQSVKPSNFMNASPFQKRTVKKDPMKDAALIGGAVAMNMAG